LLAALHHTRFPFARCVTLIYTSIPSPDLVPVRLIYADVTPRPHSLTMYSPASAPYEKHPPSVRDLPAFRPCPRISLFKDGFAIPWRLVSAAFRYMPPGSSGRVVCGALRLRPFRQRLGEMGTVLFTFSPPSPHLPFPSFSRISRFLCSQDP